jgi:hypothetical protein
VVEIPPPPIPNTPELVPVADGILIKCDGSFVNGTWSESTARVEIHHMPDAVSTVADINTQIASLVSRSGGAYLLRVTAAEGPQYIRLQTVNIAEVESELSPVVSATALPGLDDAIIASQEMGQEVSDLAALVMKTTSTRHSIF